MLRALDDTTIAELRAALPGSSVFTRDDEVAPYATDWSGVEPSGMPAVVVRARDASEVSRALQWASRHGVPTSVRGGGSGVAGGAIAYPGGLVISTAAMTRVLEVSPADRVAVVQAGVMVADVDAAAAEHGLMYAPDPVSSQIATIGGSIATNAGGFRCLAHGVTSESVSALEVVLADGRIIRTGARTRKNVVGYDLTHLVVGSEGTLGVVTEATVRLKPIPRGRQVTFVAAFGSARQAGAAVASLMSAPLSLELLELLDRPTLEIVEQHLPTGRPIPAGAVLVGMLVATDPVEQLAEVRSRMIAAGAEEVESSDDDSLLDVRRRVKPALVALGFEGSCDAAVPPSRLPELLSEIERIAAARGRRIATVAHAGDGNVHAAVESRDAAGDQRDVDDVVHEIARAAMKLGGVVSGEHGVGSTKVDLLGEQLGDEVWAIQRSIKALFDPRGILTPGRGI